MVSSSSSSPVMASTNNCSDLSRNVDRPSDEEMEESASDDLVKFLIRKNVPLDATNDPHFQSLLTNVAQQGQQASLFLDYSTVIQNSLWKYEDDIRFLMGMVIDTWRKTRCTVMSYNLKIAGTNQLVLGFYSPAGFIFLQGGRSEDEVWQELADLDPSFTPSAYNCREGQFIKHSHCYHTECQYQAFEVSNYSEDTTWFYFTDAQCIRQQIHHLWLRICKTSKWVQSLIKKTDEVFHCISTSYLSEDFYNTLKQKGFEYTHASSFERLRMVMRLRSEFTAWASSNEFKFQAKTDATTITTVIHNNEFWIDGSHLVQVLSPFYNIPTLMDTLVPSSGYLLLAIENASSRLKISSESEPLKYIPIWECFQMWREECAEQNQDLACYLNPSYYILGEDAKMEFDEYWLDELSNLACAHNEDDRKLLDAEADAYCTKSSNPFAGVSEAEFEENHPITLWEKYGGGFPLLKRCAYILLSQPTSCLCEQVEKQASKLVGSDNYILRLNELMMEEFVKLEHQIYQPIHV